MIEISSCVCQINGSLEKLEIQDGETVHSVKWQKGNKKDLNYLNYKKKTLRIGLWFHIILVIPHLLVA